MHKVDLNKGKKSSCYARRLARCFRRCSSFSSRRPMDADPAVAAAVLLGDGDADCQGWQPNERYGAHEELAVVEQFFTDRAQAEQIARSRSRSAKKHSILLI